MTAYARDIHDELGISTNNLTRLYGTYDGRVIAFMRPVVYELEQIYNKSIPLSFKIQFDLLANVLTIYYKALDDLKVAEKPIDVTRATNHIMHCTKQIAAICDGLGCNPMNKAKIKKLSSSQDGDEEAKELLNSLIS